MATDSTLDERSFSTAVLSGKHLSGKHLSRKHLSRKHLAFGRGAQGSATADGARPVLFEGVTDADAHLVRPDGGHIDACPVAARLHVSQAHIAVAEAQGEGGGELVAD